jgi:hypothetical protein
VDASGAATVSGGTQASNFPTTAGAHDRTYNGGADLFVTKLNAAGSALVYSTFVGGGNHDSVYGLVLDASGAAYLTGDTYSSNFPTTVDALDSTLSRPTDGVICKLNSTGSQLVYSTCLGGDFQDFARKAALGTSNSLYVGGWTQSQDFPTTTGAFQGTYQGGDLDAFVLRLDF